MTICFVTNEDISRHATMKRAFGLARPLLSQGHDVMILMEDHPENRLHASLIPGLKVLAYQPSAMLVIHLWRKWRLLRRVRPDVIHICGLGYRNLVPRWLVSRSLVIMDHAELESSMPGHSWLRRRLMRLAEAFSLTHYKAHVVASLYLHALFHRATNARVPILYLPFASDMQTEGATPNRSLRQLAGERQVVLFMGGLYRAYGVWDIVGAAGLLKRLGARVLFVLAGKGPEAKDLSEAIVRRGLEQMFHLAGYVPEKELPEMLAQADVFLAPLGDSVADWARCPSKLFIYMAHEKPIVTGPYGEALQYLAGQGIFYRGGAAALASAIIRALERSSQPVRYNFPRTWDERSVAYVDWLGGLVKETSEGDLS